MAFGVDNILRVLSMVLIFFFVGLMVMIYKYLAQPFEKALFMAIGVGFFFVYLAMVCSMCKCSGTLDIDHEANWAIKTSLAFFAVGVLLAVRFINFKDKQQWNFKESDQKDEDRNWIIIFVAAALAFIIACLCTLHGLNALGCELDCSGGGGKGSAAARRRKNKKGRASKFGGDGGDGKDGKGGFPRTPSVKREDKIGDHSHVPGSSRPPPPGGRRESRRPSQAPAKGKGKGKGKKKSQSRGKSQSVAPDDD